MLKFLFLDIDGVLNSSTTHTHFRGYIGIDPELVPHLLRIVDKTGCKVVLSSTWRLDQPFREKVESDVCPLFDVTPNLAGRGNRGAEVKKWLLDNKPTDQLVRHAILDDDQDFDLDQPLFATNHRYGLTSMIADQVIAYLNYNGAL